MTSRRHAILHGLTVLLLSAYPLSLVFRSNLGIVPISLNATFLILLVNLIVVTVLFGALRTITTDFAGRAAWLGGFLLLLGLYVAIVQQLSALGWPLRPDMPTVSAAYVLVSAAIATLVVRPRRLRPRDPIPMLLVATILFGTNTMIGVSRVLPLAATSGAEHGGWPAAAADFIGEAAQREVSPSAPARDVYYIILDGFGSADTLTRVYDLDLTAFVTYLTARGFHVVSQANSNYIQTYLSLASTLNLAYLDPIAAVTGSSSSDRFPLDYLIDRNALMTLARRAGYHVVAIGSDYSATERISNADRCVCEQYGSSSNMQALFAASPMLVHLLGSRFVDGHRRKVTHAFSELERATAADRRLFVFAHIVAPHPPFVFEENGNRPTAVDSIWFQDGSSYGGTRSEYIKGYRNQVTFLAHRFKTLVDTLLTRPGAPPVIVIHGDHGPGLGLNWNDADKTDMAERAGIFAAYYLPEATAQPHSGMTPINGARLLSNEYFGTAFPMVEDSTYFSTWNRPYHFLRVPRRSMEGQSNAERD